MTGNVGQARTASDKTPGDLHRPHPGPLWGMVAAAPRRGKPLLCWDVQAAQPDRTTIGHFAVESTLGVGGMGTVYRARDLRDGKTVALKRVQLAGARRPERLLELFEREYHSLAHLSHPAAIEVWEYGVDPEGAYYTMELLQGPQLRTCRDLPVPELCAILHGIASCLAVLHGRRLVHRDVTGRNIIVVAPGRAKLIDFGALSPMGPVSVLVGTPTHLAPETLLMQSLDGRTDLYSLGVVMYRMLTGRLPYRARSVQALRALWEHPPEPPHEVNPTIPEALSQLAMGLLSLDRDARPRDATEVMERLATIGGLPDSEAAGASHAHLVTPSLVGRVGTLQRIRSKLATALDGKGCGLVLRGAPGVGRSRMVDAAVLEARLRGASVVRLTGDAGGNDEFRAARDAAAAIRALAREADAGAGQAGDRPGSPAGASTQGTEAEDPPRMASSPPEQRQRMRQAAIADFGDVVQAFSARAPLVLVADDLQHLDEGSVAAIATALQHVGRCRFLLVASLPGQPDVQADSPLPLGLRLLLERSDVVALAPLSARSTRRLARTIFGSVPHVGALAEKLHRISRGHPREVLTLCEHMLGAGVIRYQAGAFALPAEIPDDALPASFSDALKQRVGTLSPLAARIAQAHALGERRALTARDAAALAPGGDTAAVRAALEELVSADILAASDVGYVLQHASWQHALCDGLGGATLREHHLALAGLADGPGGDLLARAYHLNESGCIAEARAALQAFTDAHPATGADLYELTALTPARLEHVLASVTATLDAQPEDFRLKAELRYLLMNVGAFLDSRPFTKYGDEAEAYLRAESGWDHYQQLDPGMAPMQRVLEAIRLAQLEYEADPGARRFAPPEAIRHLALYVVTAIAVGARSMDAGLRLRLPALLAPFTPLSPILDAMHENAAGTAEGVLAYYEGPLARLPRVVEALSKDEAAGIEHADEICAACLYAMGVYGARLGIPAAADHLDKVADHPRQASNVLRARAMLALECGDWTGAEAHHRAAEQRDLESADVPMFGLTSVLGMYYTYARGLDLSMMGQLLGIIREEARRHPGWQASLHGALGEYHRLRGDRERALREFDACAELSEPQSTADHPYSPWYPSEASALETLLELDRVDECHARGLRALRFGDGNPRGFRYIHIKRALALCESRMGEFDAAQARLDALFAELGQLGSRGMNLGLLHEARALLALAQGDRGAAASAYARARDEMASEARRGFLRRLARLQKQLSSGDPGGTARADARAQAAAPGPRRAAEDLLAAALLAPGSDPLGVAEGLRRLCEATGCAGGHLYVLEADGPRVSGSIGDDGAPTGLHGYIVEQLADDRAAQVTAAATVVLSAARETARSESLDTSTWVETGAEEPRNYQLIWVRPGRDRDAAPLAVAALRRGPSAAGADDAERTRVHAPG